MARGAETSSLLWKIEGTLVKSPAYLAGTIHIRNEKAFALADRWVPLLRSCDAFAIEMLMNEEQNYKPDAMYMQEELLSNLLSDADIEILKRRIGERRFERMNCVKPFYLMGLIVQQDERGELPSSVDVYLQQAAENEGKRVVGIETFADQAAAVDAIALSEQAKMLSNALADLEAGGKDFSKLLNAYLDQNLKQIYALERESAISKAFIRVMLTERNHRMASRIVELITTQSVFVAIGAAHLVGRSGVIALLRKKGFSLSPVV